MERNETLPQRPFEAILFDLDGVVTRTADVHAEAWRRVFEEVRQDRSKRGLSNFRPFDVAVDYPRSVDGKLRLDGVRAFLASRGLTLPERGTDSDPPLGTVEGIGARKNEIFGELLRTEGVRAYDDAVTTIDRFRAAGLKTAAVSSSRNAKEVLRAANLSDRFDVCVDGQVVADQGLAGKPSPDSFLLAAERVGVPPSRAVVFEDAMAGVIAGRRGHFGCVIGVARNGKEDEERLREAGADVVVPRLDAWSYDPFAGAVPPVDARAHGVDEWTLAYDGFDPEDEPLREALCTLGNGYFATRGAAEESSAGGVHYPGTYIHGGYDRLRSVVAGRTVDHEDLVNFPNWLPLTFRAEGAEWYDLERYAILDYRQSLHLRDGTLERRFRVRDPDGRVTTVRARRLVHMGAPHLAAIVWEILPENWSGTIEIRSGLDGRVQNENVARYAALERDHLDPIGSGTSSDGVWLEVTTRQSNIRMVQAARVRCFLEDEHREVVRWHRQDPEQIWEELSLEVERGMTLRVEKTVTLFTSRDRAISEPRDAALFALSTAPNWASLHRSHCRRWQELIRRCDIRLGRRPDAQLVLRLHVFHLLQTASPNTIDLDAGVPARGLHGEAYRGHIFWDEVFVFPYLNLRFPELTRALLMYRYRRLDRARDEAAREGYRGALFPWQSGSDGREESQRSHLNPRSGRWLPDDTFLQRHVNAAIAYNVWQYHQATHDRQFLSFFGAEMFLEIARFFSSLAEFDPRRGRYVIRGVVGPDEYHTAYPGAERPGLDNNAYTNVLACWVFRTVPRVLSALDDDRRAELLRDLDLDALALSRFEDIARRMFVPFHDGLISQFEGYEDLEELDWVGYRTRYGDIQRLDRILEAEGDSPNRYKIGKQADVLMLFYLFTSDELQEIFDGLGYRFDRCSIPTHIDYYAQRTSHGSTLSRLVHSWVFARADRHSWRLFEEALRSDVEDVQGGTTHEGIHLGAMAGTVDLMQRCYGGVLVLGDALRIDPKLPDALDELEMRVRYVEHCLSIRVERAKVAVTLEDRHDEPLTFFLRGERITLAPGCTVVRALPTHSS